MTVIQENRTDDKNATAWALVLIAVSLFVLNDSFDTFSNFNYGFQSSLDTLSIRIETDSGDKDEMNPVPFVATPSYAFNQNSLTANIEFFLPTLTNTHSARAPPIV